VVGFHWFNPPHLIPLVEVIRGDRTSDAAMDGAYRLAQGIGKSPIRVQKDIAGFVGNRLQRALEREFFYLERIGACSGADLEVALKQGLGYRWSVVGPLEHADLAGVDTGTHMQVVYHLWSETSEDWLRVVVDDLDREAPRCPSVTFLWKGAEWMEREAYDMFGIVFEGNRDVRRIYLPAAYVSFPLRKDFHLPDDASRSPGRGVRPMEESLPPRDATPATNVRRAQAG